jgi:hypothetical protein
MSLAALAVIAGTLASNGTARQPDEGAAAHIWQILVCAQLPIAAFFAIRWLPRTPRAALWVLLVQLMALLAAAAPAFLLHL